MNKNKHTSPNDAAAGAADDPADGDAAAALQRARWALYGSHTLSTWGQRSWEFAVGLLMLQLRPQSLALVSAYGLADSGAQVLTGAAVGSYLSRTGRLRGASRMYMMQNAAVAASAAAVFPLLSGSPPAGLMFWVATCITIACGSISSVGAMGSTLAVEREWAKALCQGDSAALAALNSGMRRIDLTCLIVAPVAVGFLMTFGGSRAAVAAICLWNLVVWVPEVALLSYSVRQTPNLREGEVPAMTSEETVDQLQLPDQSVYNAQQPIAAKRGNALRRTLDGWHTYAKQLVLPAAFALALLYLTVMSLGLLMTAYLKSLGMTEAVLSLFRGVGAASGVAATITYPVLHRRLGGERAGTLGIWAQAGCLWVSIAPSLATKTGAALPAPLVSHVLVLGVAASRWGLWTFDLAVSQMLQERVADRELNVVSGVQGSLQSLFGMSSYIAALAFPDLLTFPWLMLASCSVVVAAALIYSAFQQPGGSTEETQAAAPAPNAAASHADPEPGGGEAEGDRLLPESGTSDA